MHSNYVTAINVAFSISTISTWSVAVFSPHSSKLRLRLEAKIICTRKFQPLCASDEAQPREKLSICKVTC